VNGVVYVTDHDWFRFLASRPDLEEVNFWRPRDLSTPRQLAPGMPVLFKLRKQHGGAIVGYGVFAKHRVMPAWLAWDLFGPSNGASTFAEMLARIVRLRGGEACPAGGAGDFDIGCVMLSQPVFLPAELWVRPPDDWSDTIVQGRGYDLASGEGARVWHDVLAASSGRGAFGERPQVAEGPRYGEPVLVRPRLGQGTFRISVLDAYGQACAVTHEHSLPALEAGHIRPFANDGPREVTNGLLLRSDLHRLFDKGYVGVDAAAGFKFVVSGRLRDDFSNGRSYYPLHGEAIALPARAADHPDPAQFRWHLEHVFRG
jgi:putative restriction endonuclease